MTTGAAGAHAKVHGAYCVTSVSDAVAEQSAFGSAVPPSICNPTSASSWTLFLAATLPRYFWRCDITGKRSNNANRVSFSNKKWARLQEPNLQTKRLFSKELDRFVRLKVATSTLRTIRKLGLDETAKKYEIDLSKF